MGRGQLSRLGCLGSAGHGEVSLGLVVRGSGCVLFAYQPLLIYTVYSTSIK